MSDNLDNWFLVSEVDGTEVEDIIRFDYNDNTYSDFYMFVSPKHQYVFQKSYFQDVFYNLSLGYFLAD